MAEKNKPMLRERLNEDDLIEQLVPDPSQTPDVKVLAGYLGHSNREGTWRLYTSPTLNAYVEFSESDVVYSRSLEHDDNPLGGTVVWVQREANLRHTQTATREAQADFLQGSIVAGSMGRAASNGQLAAFRPHTGHGGAIYSAGISCVREFCDFVINSFLGGGSVFCTSDYGCGVTWAAECG